MSKPRPTPAANNVSGMPLYAGRHLRFGWLTLLTYLSLGIGLEVLHGFKVSWYLDVGYETRRLMFTLAHAHGALLGVVHIATGLTLHNVKGLTFTAPTSFSLITSSVLLPLGFLLGGIIIHEGDPGLGILLVPIGAFLLLYGVGRVVWSLSRVPLV